MSQEDQEKEIIANMTKNFVPIDTTDLASVVPENDRILCSLMCTGKLRAEARPSHVLLTPSGIAYRFISIKNQFRYWHSRPKYEIKLKKSDIMVDRYRLSFDRKIKEQYSDEVYTLLKENFASYCKILSRDFQDHLEEIRLLNGNEALLNSKINNTNPLEFLNTIQMFYYAGFHKEIFSIIEKVLESIQDNDKTPFLLFFARIIIDIITKIKRKFTNSNNLPDMLLPLYQKVVDNYDQILKRDSSNKEILEKREFFQDKYNFYTIPYDDTKRAYQLYVEADTRYQEEYYEGALHYFKESYKLNPYFAGLKERIAELLKMLGKSE